MIETGTKSVQVCFHVYVLMLARIVFLDICHPRTEPDSLLYPGCCIYEYETWFFFLNEAFSCLIPLQKNEAQMLLKLAKPTLNTKDEFRSRELKLKF